jgi:hypothetical protein
MAKARAAAGTTIFLVIAPGIVAGLLPWLITGWHQGSTRPAVLTPPGAC